MISFRFGYNDIRDSVESSGGGFERGCGERERGDFRAGDEDLQRECEVLEGELHDSGAIWEC